MKIIMIKGLVTGFYIFMIYMNFLANALPLNNQNTGEISNKYPSLFTPSGYAFSIWGIIYLLLAIFVLKTLFSTEVAFTNQYLLNVMILFIGTSILNILWLLAWHYDYIALSSVFMLLFLVLNVLTVRIIPNSEVLMKTTFSIYLGWIMVAFIANITIMLVKYDLSFFTNHELIWYLVTITVGLIIVGLVLFFDRNVVVALVFVWAYLAIFAKHVTKEGYHLTLNAPIIYTGAILCIITILSIFVFVENGFKTFY